MIWALGVAGTQSSGFREMFGTMCKSFHPGAAARNGMAFVVPHFRGCSGEMNLAPRAYHSGDYEEIDWILQRLCQVQSGPLLVAGVSLGGNALLRWAAEAGASYNQRVRAVAGICAPVDLQAAGQALGRGLNRLVYTPIFLRTMKPKALRKLAQFPGLFDARRMLAARTLYEFDNVVTAPLHGFADTDDYWRRASAKPHLGHIRVPALVLNALNDPFIPAGSLPDPALRGASPSVTWWRPDRHEDRRPFLLARNRITAAVPVHPRVQHARAHPQARAHSPAFGRARAQRRARPRTCPRTPTQASSMLR